MTYQEKLETMCIQWPVLIRAKKKKLTYVKHPKVQRKLKAQIADLQEELKWMEDEYCGGIILKLQ